jgi:excisionase family DNA binding protein
MNQAMPQPLNRQDFISKRKAAAVLGVAPRTIDRMIEAGELAAFKPAIGRTRVVLQSVRKLLESATPTK